MVRFVDVPHMRAWIQENTVPALIRGLVTCLEEDFLRWNEFDKTPRVASHSPTGVIELMPAADRNLYGFKYVNGHPENPDLGLQTVTAFGALADMDTGYPLLVTEMTLLTALRTAATSAMAARLLARPNSTTMALIGTGSQSEFQTLAFQEMLGITHIRAWDTDPAALDKFTHNADRFGIRVHRATSAHDAVDGADIITTCTADKQHAVVLTDSMVAPGVHVNAIGGDCPGKTELAATILTRSNIFVEYTPQTRIEGEIQQLDPQYPVTELWEVLAGQKAGRRGDQDITVFDSVGFAVEDFSALRFLDNQITGTRFFEDVTIIADPHDPKNLYSLLIE